MKVNVTIAGASYSEVPSILIPLKNGGRARFCEVSDTTAKAADVAKGKKFYTSEGELVIGTADLSQGIDTRKTITMIQQEHQKLTLACNHPELSSQTDSEGNTVYATTYQDYLNIGLTADADYYAGKITINGTEQESSSSNPQIAYVSVPISDGMAVPFTDVSLTMTGQGSQWLIGHLLVTTKQSPESPKIVGVGALESGNHKGLLFLLDEEKRYSGCKVEITTGTGISDTIELSYSKDIDLGVTMGGEISDALYSYLAESSEANAEVILTVKVVG